MKVIAVVLFLSIVGYAACECEHEALLPNPNDCTTFFQCFHNNLDLHHCPEGLTFHPKKGICDYPGPGDSCPTGKLNVGRAVPVCPPPTQGQANYLADPDDCTSFYECNAFGDPIHLRCSPGLAYNAKLQVCDWPENVTPPCKV